MWWGDLAKLTSRPTDAATPVGTGGEGEEKPLKGRKARELGGNDAIIVWGKANWLDWVKANWE